MTCSVCRDGHGASSAETLKPRSKGGAASVPGPGSWGLAIPLGFAFHPKVMASSVN